MSASTSANTSTGPLYPDQHQANVTPSRQPMQQNQTKPLSSIPAHVRSEFHSLGSTSIPGTSNAISADVKGKGPAHPTGLNTPITPLHPPPQRPNLKPPQYQHQTERRVSFADHQQEPTTKPAATAATMDSELKHSPADFDADDSFGFNSDDDALFALADLGPPIDPDGADEGRPIGNDEGRPINSNEGLLGAGSADDTMIGDDVFDQYQHQKKNELVGVVSASKLSRQEMITVALMSAEESDITSDSLQRCPSGSNHTTSGTSNTLLQANADTNTSSSMLGLARQQQNQNQKSALNLTSLAQQRHQRHMAQRQNQNENPNQMGLLSSSSSRVESKRASTPSIGGFHFPAGSVCPGLFRREADSESSFPLLKHLQQVNLTTSSTSSSGIGSKRPAEAMA
jgi:DNA repair and recombination protein RAD52